MRFTAAALVQRKPVWIALAELYVDTAPDWERVAVVCARSPFSLGQLQRILYDEVHPVLHLNLWLVAGVAAGFDSAWLVTAICARRRRPLFRLPWPERWRYPWCPLRGLIVAERSARSNGAE